MCVVCLQWNNGLKPATTVMRKEKDGGSTKEAVGAR
jgi:hypothetical protein